MYGAVDRVALTLRHLCCGLNAVRQLRLGQRDVSVESVKFGERCVVPRRSAGLFRGGMPIPSQAAAESTVISRTVVLAAEGVEARRQTRTNLNSGILREGMVQTTNLKRAAKAEVGSIIPWLQVRILPVPVNCGGAFRVIARNAPLFLRPVRGCFEPRMGTN